jgi:biofilm PGA synthesis lipoprotein PgaB
MLQFTDYLTQRARFYRPLIKTARNIYALPILQPESEEWYAQNLKGFLKHYDYTAIEAMPYMEKATQPEAWLKELVGKVAREPQGLKQSVFELQTVDWNTQKPIPMEIFQKEIKILKDAGVQHIGYYPDNPYDDQPKLETLKKHFSVEIQP